MRNLLGASALLFGATVAACGNGNPAEAPGWPQWAHDAQHASAIAATGQPLDTIEYDEVFDPSVETNLWVTTQASAHYMTPLNSGGAVYIEKKGGTYSTTSYSTQTWGVARLTWEMGALVQQWVAMSDWTAVGGTADFWEPVFHGAIANGYLYVPGAKGTILKLDEASGALVSRIAPDSSWDANTYTVSPITADASGHLYFTVLRLSGATAAALLPADEIVDANQEGSVTPGSSTFYGSDAVDSFLVEVAPDDSVRFASISTLVPDAPGPTDGCETTFADVDLPWPPGTTATPPTADCGTQRAALNAAPAIAADGTIIIVSRAHFTSRYTYLVAINPDLTRKWDASLRDRFNDGCGVPYALGGQLPPNGAPGGCAGGANYGVDPATNRPGGGRAIDDSSASPVVAPDGTIYYGAYTSYNYSQGHLMRFSASGAYLGAYPFGWDTTPAIYVHDGTFSLVTKDNHYGDMGSYCSNATYCPTDRNATAPAYPEAYFITELSPQLQVQWRHQATNQQTCEAGGLDGGISCVSDHPFSFEWCVNAPAVDANGTVYATSEDGWLYAIDQGGSVRDRLFEQAALSDAYTPVSLDADGRAYSLNSGRMFVVGR
jgi:outer membrane protein assembly factor BamB